MPQQRTIVILYGGNSGEHEVSSQSAAAIFHHLNKQKYNIIPLAIDKKGDLFLHCASALDAYKEALPVHHQAAKKIPSLINNGRFFMDADCVFPAIHGPLYEDGCLQGILESANIAYVGCDVLSSALGMDKDMARRIACSSDIKCAQYRVVDWRMSDDQKISQLNALASRCQYPLFIKPCALGSSVGIQKVSSLQEGLDAINNALKYDTMVLIEEFIDGREIELAVLEDTSLANTPKCSLPGEITIHHADGFYSYDAKYIQSSSCELTIPAQLPSALIERLQQAAIQIFNALRCKGMARVDFFVQNHSQEIYFNEINTLPGFTPISMYPKLWECSGLSYADLLDELIALAQLHHRAQEQCITSYC